MPPAPGGPAQGPYGGLPPYPQQPYGAQGPYQSPYPAPGQAPGPYGYGYGYGYPGAGGWYPGPPPNQSTNGLAIASLTVSLAAFCLPIVSMLLGIFGLRQIRRNGQRGRGLAIAGIVINGVATALVALFVVLAVIGTFDEGNTDVQDIQIGQCFNAVDSKANYGGGGHRASTVDVVPCSDEHEAEAYAVFSLASDFGDDYPGVVQLADGSGDKCQDYAEDYLGDEGLDARMESDFYIPTKAGWNRGHRSVTCFFESRAGKITGSVRGDGGTSGADGSGGSDGGSGGSSDPSVGV